MGAILKKMRIIFLSNVNALLDKVIDLNSTEAVKQYIRDLEEAITELNESLAEARGDLATDSRKLASDMAKATELDASIDVLLGDNDPSNDGSAATLQQRLNTLKRTIETDQQNVVADQKDIEGLSHVLEALKSKHESMMEVLGRIESNERSAAADNRAADALNAANAALGTAGAVSVDNVVARTEHSADVAAARMGAALGEFEDTADQDVERAQALADIAARKARLAGASAPTDAVPAGTPA